MKLFKWFKKITNSEPEQEDSVITNTNKPIRALNLGDEKIVSIAKELIEAIKKQGYPLNNDHNARLVDIWIFNDKKIEVGSIIDGWEVVSEYEYKEETANA